MPVLFHWNILLPAGLGPAGRPSCQCLYVCPLCIVQCLCDRPYLLFPIPAMYFNRNRLLLLLSYNSSTYLYRKRNNYISLSEAPQGWHHFSPQRKAPQRANILFLTIFCQRQNTGTQGDQLYFLFFRFRTERTTKPLR